MRSQEKSFEASKSNRFRLDHVVLTAQGINLPAPTVEVFDSDSTVVLSVDRDEVEAVAASGSSLAFYVDGEERYPTEGLLSNQLHFAALPLDTFSLGSHFVHLVVEDANQTIIDFAGPAWFTRKPINELVKNGSFEQGLAHWDQISGVHYVVDNEFLNFGPYQGTLALGIGWVGSPHQTSVGQTVSIPPNIKSLKFSARISRSFEFEGDQDPKDTLYVDFLDSHGNTLVSEIVGIVPDVHADHDPPSLIRTYRLVSFTPSTAALSGKAVTMRLRFVENELGKSLYRIDNVSLTYADWGLQLLN